MDYLDFIFKSIHYNTAKLTNISTTATIGAIQPPPGSNVSSMIKLKSETSEDASNEKTSNSNSLKLGLMSPPILIVGTNKNGLAKANRSELVRKKFERIREFVSSKIYSNHILEPYFAIETTSLQQSSTSLIAATTTTMTNGEHKEELDDVMGGQKSDRPDSGLSNSVDLEKLKKRIQIAALSEPYMGEQQPLKWMNFDKSLEKLKNKGLFYASLSQVRLSI